MLFMHLLGKGLAQLRPGKMVLASSPLFRATERLHLFEGYEFGRSVKAKWFHGPDLLSRRSVDKVWVLSVTNSVLVLK
jgi:hypothetical protein